MFNNTMTMMLLMIRYDTAMYLLLSCCWSMKDVDTSLKLNIMQLVTPGGSHYCLMANDVHN